MTWRADPDAALVADLASDSTTGPLIAGSAPDGPVRGTLKERYFFRRAAGNGWTLVGDAGHHKEFVIGDGITEALLQARGLASAIAKGTDAALHRWWRARDVDALPALLPGAGRRSVRASDEASASCLFACGEDARSPGAARGHHGAPALAPGNLPGSTSAVVDTCGRFPGIARPGARVLRDGRRGSAIDRELRLRRRLLAEAEASDAEAAKIAGHACPRRYAS